jgi:hypothetical protein
VSYSPLQDEQKPDTTTKGKGRQRNKKPATPVVLTPEEQAKEQERQERHRGVLARIVMRRGYEMDDRDDIIAEHNHINKLMDKFNDKQIDAIHKYLFEEHWKWSKPENKYNIGAYIIWKEANAVAQILKERREKGQPSGKARSESSMLIGAAIHAQSEFNIEVQRAKEHPELPTPVRPARSGYVLLAEQRRQRG